MAPKTTGNEQEQILQTVEMFEVITRSNPDDYQSLDLLREAYRKLGREDQVLRVGRMLGEAYVRSGQYAAALEEFDHILRADPSQDDLVQMRQQVAERLEVEEALVGGRNQGLIRTGQTQGEIERPGQGAALPDDDGNDPLARFLIAQDLVPPEIVQEALGRVRETNAALAGNGEHRRLAASLLEEVLRHLTVDEGEALCAAIVDHTKHAYIPLEYYEADRQVLKMLPEEITLGRLMVPFDLLSRTIFVASCNPFDAAGRDAVQRHLDYNLQWFFAMPSAIAKMLREAYRLPGEGVGS